MTAAPGPRSRRPRAAANYGPQRGTTYLIHIDPPYKHAKHYKGWTDRPVGQRFADHLAGRGALLTRLAVRAGSRLTLARVWPNTTKDREDAIKRSGGKRMCPECGVTPGHTRLASDRPPEPDDRRPRWQYERDGEWADDGTPIIYDPSQTYAQARAEAAQHPVVLSAEDREELAALDKVQRQWTNQEEQVGLRDAVARTADAIRGQREAHRRRAANREADRLWAIADALDRQMGRRPGYQHELTAERAARIRARIGVDLAVDAHIEAMPRAEGQPLEQWAITPENVAQPEREPVLQGADLDAEIDRLAEAFREPEGPTRGDDTHEAEPPQVIEARVVEDLWSAAARAEAMRRLEAWALAREHVAREGHDDSRAARAQQEADRYYQARREAEAAAYETAAGLQALGSDIGAGKPGPEPMGRTSPEGAQSAAPAPVAAAQPSGTAHTDPALAERGWQADTHGVYARNPQAEAPGAHRGAAQHEAGAPDHLYGAPECAEADPEGAHFGNGPGEPQDTGQGSGPEVERAGPYGSFGGWNNLPLMHDGFHQEQAAIEQAMRSDFPALPARGGYQAEAS